MTTSTTGAPAWVGRSVARKEDRSLVTGAGRYVADIKLPGTVDVAFLRSSFAHARLDRVAVDKARGLEGVLAVVTAGDIAQRVAPFTRFVDQEHTPPGLEAAVHPIVRPCPMEVLAGERVRYVGQAIAAVVAVDRYVAEDALEHIEVDYTELPAVTDVEQAIAAGGAQLHEGIDDNIQATFGVSVGDPDAAFAAAPYVRSFKFHSQRLAGSPMETRGVLASFSDVTDELTVWSSTQTPHMVRTRIAEQLGIPEQQIRVIAPHVGGGFGPKAQVYPEEVLVAHLARQLRRPVRWIEDRREHLMATAQSRDQVHFLEVAFDEEGVISALRDRFLVDSGAYNPFSITCSYNTAAHLRSVYKIPHYQIRGDSVLTNKTPNVPYRGAGRPEGAFAMDRTIYEVARVVGKDVAEVVRANLIPADQMPYERGMPYRDGVEIVYDCGDFPAAFEQLLEVVGYEQHVREQPELRAKGIWRGIGFGTYVEGTGIGPFEGATVRLDSEGHVVVNSGSSPHGQSHDTTMSQVVADEFNLDPAEVVFRAGDTGLVPYGVGTFASRSAVAAGSAVVTSAQKLKRKVLSVAAELLEASEDDLELKDGHVHVRGMEQKRISLREIYGAAAPGPWNHLPAGSEPGTAETHYFVPPTVTWGAGFQAAVVEVDPETGFVDLKKMVVIHDCGRIINPLVVEGQIDGGVLQGVGAALYEKIVYDEDGQPQTTTFMDYLLPTSAEAPEVVQIHLDAVSERNPLGVKGVGEAGTISPPSAIAGAIDDALGPLRIDIRELPLSPSVVLGLIEQARSHATPSDEQEEVGK